MSSNHLFWATRVTLVACLAMAGSAAAAEPVGAAASQRALGQAIAPVVVAAADEPLTLSYVPADARLVISVRPAAILAQPVLAGLAREVRDSGSFAKQFGVAIDHIEQATICAFEIGPKPPAAIVLHVKDPGDALSVVKQNFADSSEQFHSGRKYRRSPNGRSICLFPPGSRTVVICEEEQLLHKLIDAGEAGAAKALWAERWNEVGRAHAGLYIETELLRTIMGDVNLIDQGPLLAFAPLWENTASIVASAVCDDKLQLSVRMQCPTAAEAGSVAETLTAARTLGRNWLTQIQKVLVGLDQQTQALVAEGSQLLEQMRIETRETRVQIDTATGVESIGGFLAAQMKVSLRAAVGARTAQSKNNLKMIGLAFHNYHDVYGHFPPAVLFGKGGQGDSPHGHSWRVAILPFLEQAQLYEAYKFDEPWDSPANKQVLEKMPAIFRDPNAPANSTNSSYFGLTSPETIFSGKAGVGMRQITDGTSNTFMVVEAKRDIPWSKPEDIPYDLKKAVPDLGGHYPEGFLAAFCDGSVRLVLHALNEKTLRNLIQMNDGNPLGPLEP